TYIKARYYDPVAMRFLSPDPVYVDLDSGGNFNRYWYADNNPYTYTDPDGLCPPETGTRICINARNFNPERSSGLNVAGTRELDDAAMAGRSLVRTQRDPRQRETRE